jgi:hypothetical protein
MQGLKQFTINNQQFTIKKHDKENSNNNDSSSSSTNSYGADPPTHPPTP